jgi:hypothetical protein
MSVASSSKRRRQASEEHGELVELYRRRDVDGAVELSLRHIAETHRLGREAFEAMQEAADEVPNDRGESLGSALTDGRRLVGRDGVSRE